MKIWKKNRFIKTLEVIFDECIELEGVEDH